MKIYKISQSEDFFTKIKKMMADKGYVTLDNTKDRVQCVKYADGTVFFTFASKDGSVKLGIDCGGLYFSNSGDSIADSNKENTLTIAGVVTDPKFRGQGLASKIMKDFMDCAKLLKIKVDLEPKPMRNYIEKDKASLSDKKLSEWYKGMGFKRLDPNNYPKSDRILTTHPMEVIREKEEKDEDFV